MSLHSHMEYVGALDNTMCITHILYILQVYIYHEKELVTVVFCPICVCAAALENCRTSLL